MSEEPYVPYEKDHEQMILRDYLAVDRTMMTNEASFMSYVRTALTLIAAGVSLIKLFPDGSMQFLAWAFIVVGGLLAVHGFNRFREIDRILLRVKGDTMNRAKKLRKSRVGSTLRFVLGMKQS